jgi:hypothetical protein
MLSSADDKIDYALARIGEGDFLLPAQSELTMSDLDGGENRNHVKFTSCRQFSGESVITFGDAPVSGESKDPPAPTREFDLPQGLDIQLSLVSELNMQKVAIGDPVRARLDRDVKKDGQVLVPKGAIATGRVTRFEKYDTYWILGLEFPEIESPGIVARMKGRLENTVGISLPHLRYGIHSRSPVVPGEGVFPVNGTQTRLPRGCIMFWRT